MALSHDRRHRSIPRYFWIFKNSIFVQPSWNFSPGRTHFNKLTSEHHTQTFFDFISSRLANVEKYFHVMCAMCECPEWLISTMLTTFRIATEAAEPFKNHKMFSAHNCRTIFEIISLWRWKFGCVLATESVNLRKSVEFRTGTGVLLATLQSEPASVKLIAPLRLKASAVHIWAVPLSSSSSLSLPSNIQRIN